MAVGLGGKARIRDEVLPAETARKRFQNSVIEQRRPLLGRLDSKADLTFRNILSAVVENAQLAALEIADGVDPARASNNEIDTSRSEND